MPRHAPQRVLIGLLPLLLLLSCAELTALRERAAEQDKVSKRLQKENAEFQAAYYKIKETLDSENTRTEKAVSKLQRELDQARNLKSKQEKDLGDQLRTRNLEYEALKRETADQKTAADAQIAKLTRDLQGITAERDAALVKLKDLDERLRAELARASELTKTAAALKVDAKTLNDRVAGLQKESADKDKALQAEKDGRQAAEKKLAEAEKSLAAQKQSLDQATSETAQLRKQAGEATAARKTLAQIQKEKAALTAQIEDLKTSHTKALEQLKIGLSKTGKKESLADDSQLQKLSAQLSQKLKALPEAKGIQVRVDRRGLRVIIPGARLFDENATILAARAAGALAPIAESIKLCPGREVRVEGHTDNQAIKDLPFADNWGLGFARADRVRDFLMKEGGIAGDRLIALSRAQFDPLAANDTPEGRALNRRVEIVIGAKGAE